MRIICSPVVEIRFGTSHGLPFVSLALHKIVELLGDHSNQSARKHCMREQVVPKTALATVWQAKTSVVPDPLLCHEQQNLFIPLL